MWTALLTNITSFISKQIGVILSIGAGLLVIVRLASYIERNAVTRLEKRQLQDTLQKIKHNQGVRDEYGRKINSLNRDGVIGVMRDTDQFRRPDTGPISSLQQLPDYQGS